MKKTKYLILIFVILCGVVIAQSYYIGVRNFRTSKAILEKNITFRELFYNLDEFIGASFATLVMEKGLEVKKLELILDDDIVLFTEKLPEFDLKQFLINPANYIFGIIEDSSKADYQFTVVLKCQNHDDALSQQKLLRKLLQGIYSPVVVDEFVIISNRDIDTEEIVNNSLSLLDKLDDNVFAYGEMKSNSETTFLYGKILNDILVLKGERPTAENDEYFSELLNLPLMFGYSVSIDPRDSQTLNKELERLNLEKDILELVKRFSDLIGRIYLSADISEEGSEKVVFLLKGDGNEIMKKVEKGIPGLTLNDRYGVKIYSYMNKWDIVFGNWYMAVTKNVDPVSVAIRVETGNRFDSNHVYYSFKKLGVETPFFEKIINLNDIFGELLNQELQHILFYQKGIYLNKLIDIFFIK